MQHLKRIKVFAEHLQLGMFVAELDREWSESSFLLQGFTIESEADIAAVSQQCEFVYVDFRSNDEFKAYKLKTTQSPTYRAQIIANDANPESKVRERLKPAARQHKRASRLVKGILDKVMLGEDFDVHGVKASVKENVKEVLKNQDAMLMMTMLKSTNEDIAAHSLNVSILSIGFGHSLGFDETVLEDIGMASLLHDIGHIKVDQRILKKKGKLNQNERSAVAEHPKMAFEILSMKTGLTPSCIDVAMSHHERLGGQGYPRALKGEHISDIVRLVAIVDVFDSLTSPQSYRKAMSVMEAYKVLMAGKNTHFDESLVLKFIQWRSIYPPGSIVEMENGEVGIVVKANTQHKLKPKVMLVLDEYKQIRRERLIDIAKIDLDPESKPYKIVRAYENMAFGIDLQEYAEKGLRIQP